MPTFYASGASDDLCHFYGGGYDEEFGATAGRKVIALSSHDPIPWASDDHPPRKDRGRRNHL